MFCNEKIGLKFKNMCNKNISNVCNAYCGSNFESEAFKGAYYEIRMLKNSENVKNLRLWDGNKHFIICIFFIFQKFITNIYSYRKLKYNLFRFKRRTKQKKMFFFKYIYP